MSVFKMLLASSRILSRSNCILILVMSNLAASAPPKSRWRSPNESERGFSTSPRVLEIQLPLRIASKEDLIAWSKYVMGLMASKMNLASFGAQQDKRAYLADNSASKSKDATRRTSSSATRKLKEPHTRSPHDKVVAYPLPIGQLNLAAAKPARNSLVSNRNGNVGGSIDRTHYQRYYSNVVNPFRRNEPDVLTQSPAATYLPVPPPRTPSIATDEDTLQPIEIGEKDASGFAEPVKQQSMRNSLNVRFKAFNDEFVRGLPIPRNDGSIRKNLVEVTREPLVSLPFQALITFGQRSSDTTNAQPGDYFATRVRDPPDEFPPYFERNGSNESGQVSVVFDDSATGTRQKVKENVEEEEEEEEEQQQQQQQEQQEQEEKEENEEEENTRKKKKEKKKKGAKQQSSKKRQSVLGDLLRMLGVLRKLPNNTSDVTVATPVLSILKGTNKAQVSLVETPPPLPNRGRRNETQSQAQVNDDDDDDDDDEEEEGGFIRTFLELLPVAAPILEELSDPNSDINIPELLRGAIPLIEGFFDVEQGGVDLPEILLPVLQRISVGEDGQGSDAGALLGPIIQLVAPLIGPLVGPLIGPLSSTLSGAEGIGGIAAALTTGLAPLSEPGPYGQSILSGLISGITARLSKDLAASAGDSDVQAIVSSLVSGLLAGTSAGSTTASKGGHKYGSYQNDTYYSPTTYGGYHHVGYPSYHVGGLEALAGPLKEILAAVLRLVATSSTSGASLSGASSSAGAGLSASSSEGSLGPPHRPIYGAHPTSASYAPPSSTRPSYYPGSTNSPYASVFARRTRQQTKKKGIK